jgi:hypothetical protein
MMRAATAAGDAARAAAAYDDLAAISRSAESGAPVRTQLARMKPR